MRRRFIEGTLYSTGGMLLSTLGVLVAGKLLTNALDLETVGHFAVLLLCAEFLGTLVNLGLPVTLPKLIQARDEDGRRALLASLLPFQLAVAAAAGGACAAAACFGPLWLPRVASWLPLPAPLLAMLPVLLVVVALRDYLLAASAGLHDYRRRAGAILLITSMQVLLFSALYYYDSGAPLPFAASYLFAVAGGASMLARSQPRPWRIDWGEILAPLRFSLPLYANTLMNFVYQRADTLLVVYFLGIGAGALFEMAKRVPGVLSRFFGAALIPYLPSVAELLRTRERERAARLIQRASIYTAFTGYAITLLTVAVQKPLLGLLFTSDYTEAAPALGPLMIAACLAVQAGIMGQALIALERPWTVMYVNIGLAALSLALNAVLLPRMGLAGAGWSAVAASLFSYALQRVAVARAGFAAPVGRGLLVHLLFIAAYALPLIRGGETLTLAAAAVVYVAGCLALRAVSVAELRTLLWRGEA